MNSHNSLNLQSSHWGILFPTIVNEVFSTSGSFNGRILWEPPSGKHLSFDRVICSVNRELVEISEDFRPFIEQIQAERPQLHDGLILRLVSEDVSFNKEWLELKFNLTSYLRYQASKRASIAYSDSEISMQVAGEACVFSQYKETSYLIFSLRNSRRGIDDFYRYHSCAGVSSFDHSKPVVYPHERAIIEVNEESGIPIYQLKAMGISGIVTDDYFRRSAVLVKCETEQQLDEYFYFKPGSSLLQPKFETDKEVNLTAIEWSPQQISAFLLGQDGAYPFPLVRTFWIHVLLEGSISFGTEWRKALEEEYRSLFTIMQDQTTA
jgi:hypothetical protein